jgi:hypothetical protein
MSQTERTRALLQKLAEKETNFENLLAPGRVAICLGMDVAMKPQAQALFSFAVNLLARLHPVVQDLRVIVPRNVTSGVRFPRWHADTFEKHIGLFLQSLQPPLSWTVQPEPTGGSEVILAVGSCQPLGEAVVSAGSDGWDVFLSPSGVVPVGERFNPVGAYAAACIAVGEVWKRLLFPHREMFEGRPIVPLSSPLVFSTFTYRAFASEPNPPIDSALDLCRLTMIGLGAGGGATAFTLASLPNVKGLINLIEPDSIVDTNLNRYVFSDLCDAARGKTKVQVVEEFLGRFTGLTVRPFPKAFGEVASSLAMEDYRHIVAAVHSREARREVQYETPYVLWDGGASEDGEFFIWRLVLGSTECMWCKHPPGEGDVEQQKAAQLAKLLGLNAETWLRKLRDNEPFGSEEVSAIRRSLEGQELSFDLPSAGQRFGDWEASQCGRLRFPEVDEEIPVPFAPVMAGVLLAGEIIKEHAFPGAVLNSYYWNTLVGQFMQRNRPWRRLPRPDCSFCRDQTYLSQYQKRWGVRIQQR